MQEKKICFSTCELFWFDYGSARLFVWLVTESNARHYVISLQVKFQLNFEYSLDQLQNRAEVKFEAKRYTELIRNSINNCVY